MIGGQQAAAAQVTPAGAAIKLHFACNKNNNNNNINNTNNNNNNNNSNKNNNMYAGLKTVVEHKMNIKNANNNHNNNNNSNATNNNNNNGEKSTTEMRKIFENINDGSGSVYRSLGSCVSAASPLGAFRAVPRAASILVTPGSSTIMGVSKGIGPVAQTLKGLQPRSCGVSLASGTMLGVTRGNSVGIVTGFPAGLRLLPAPIPKGKPPTVGGGDSAEAIMSVGRAVEAPAATKSALVTTLNPSAAQQQPTQRTEDQENAFRRIEDVHNYAKLQDYSSEDDDVEDDEEEELDEEEEEEDDDEADAGAKIQVPAKQEVTRIRRDDTEEHVDVVTVPQPEQECDQEKHLKEAVEIIQPEHHARRPMNAFLIFCKRHRAIVKERYKTLENRAITKILGDWWAALDEQEKHCFTDLAQQNKDAFFNANPNFKWYKLPAPPLRTLATRPSNAATGGIGSSGDDNQPSPHPTQLQLQKIPLDLLRSNYFKLADETQMGELSSLLQVQVQEKDYALQQVLSETSQFLSAHMPGATGNQPATGLKRSFDSQSSNSSEEEGVATGSPNKKAKSSRSCKGKIYQELVNSGQLAAINKKGKNRNPTVSGNFTDTSLDAAPNTPPISPPERPQSSRHQRSVSESSSSGFFNLEERIKELPALSLDAYLQRKRSTKKKKKFSGSRKQRNILNSSSSGARAALPDPAVVAGDLERIKQQQQQQQLQKQHQRQQAAAVGSQRRKARKESITRRDVSAIEQEVASILPLTINGCYYFNESPVPKAASGPVTIVASNSSSPLSSNSSSFSSPNLEETSSTSDLLILAEVAANRTELTKSN